jgi:hypothetical protein
MKKTGIIAVLLLAGLLLTMAFVLSASGYTLSGYVTDVDSGAFLNGTLVNITIAKDYTNISGYYEFSGLSNGTYLIHAYKFSYQAKNVSVTIAGTNKTQNITLNSWGLDPASSDIVTVSEESYNEFEDAVMDFNWSASLLALTSPYTAMMGNFFFLILFALPFLMAWIRQSNVIIPTIWGFTIGGIMLMFLPKEYVGMAVLFLILSFVAVMYGVFKERF